MALGGTVRQTPSWAAFWQQKFNCKYFAVYVCIQGVSWLVDITAADDFLGLHDLKKKSKIEHVFVWNFFLTKTQEIIPCGIVHKPWITLYRVYQNDWSGLEIDYIHKYGEQNYKY